MPFISLRVCSTASSFDCANCASARAANPVMRCRTVSCDRCDCSLRPVQYFFCFSGLAALRQQHTLPQAGQGVVGCVGQHGFELGQRLVDLSGSRQGLGRSRASPQRFLGSGLRCRHCAETGQRVAGLAETALCVSQVGEALRLVQAGHRLRHALGQRLELAECHVDFGGQQRGRCRLGLQLDGAAQLLLGVLHFAQLIGDLREQQASLGVLGLGFQRLPQLDGGTAVIAVGNEGLGPRNAPLGRDEQAAAGQGNQDESDCDQPTGLGCHCATFLSMLSMKLATRRVADSQSSPQRAAAATSAEAGEPPIKATG